MPTEGLRKALHWTSRLVAVWLMTQALLWASLAVFALVVIVPMGAIWGYGKDWTGWGNLVAMTAYIIAVISALVAYPIYDLTRMIRGDGDA